MTQIAQIVALRDEAFAPCGRSGDLRRYWLTRRGSRNKRYKRNERYCSARWDLYNYTFNVLMFYLAKGWQ